MVHQDSKIEIEMKRMRRKWDYRPRPVDQETPDEGSETIQNDTLSISDMMKRLAAGMPLTKKEGVYLHDDDEEAHRDVDYEKVGGLDLTEHEELIDEAQQVMLDFEQKKEDWIARKKAEKKEEISKEIEEEDTNEE